MEIRAQIASGELRMCRNIKILFHFDPPVTDAEIRNAALHPLPPRCPPAPTVGARSDLW